VNHAYGTVLAAAFFGGQTLLHYCLRLLSLWPLAAILDKRHKTPAPGLDRMYVPAEFSSTALLTWLISHQPAVLFSQNKPATNNQPAVLFSQNKSAPAISHQPNGQGELLKSFSKKINVRNLPEKKLQQDQM
jgi:hypothetical protein